jgi:predicted RNA binding protein YcfA (HicA-like mRNA interferase family)
MPRELRGVTAKQAIAAFQRAGFRVLRQKGSHALLYKEGSPLLVLPVHSKPLKIGLLKKELKKAGISPEDFAELL